MLSMLCSLFVKNGGVLFPIFWWCKVLSMVCKVCYLCGVIYLLRMGVYCLPSFGGVKCYLWCVLYVIYGVYCMLSIDGVECYLWCVLYVIY